jgi:multidrug efflux pump subunit AcrA (membrane-fusion protein)
LLFVLESATEDARRQAAANAYRLSRANLGSNSPILAEGEAQVRNARTRLSNDSINYNRFRELYAQNATSRAELERAELNYTLSRNNLYAQQNTLRRSRDQIRLDVENNRSQLVTSEVAGNNTRIRSFVEGKVYEVYKDPARLCVRVINWHWWEVAQNCMLSWLSTKATLAGSDRGRTLSLKPISLPIKFLRPASARYIPN